MSTYLILAAIAIVIVAMILTLTNSSLLRKRRPPTAAARRGATSIRQRSRWRAVKIAPGLIACDAAQELAGGIYLADQSPSLPLAGCAEADCRCRYIHLEDRRSGNDRRIELGNLGRFLPDISTERRRGSERRSRGVPA